MKFINILAELWCKPTLMTPQMHKQICDIVQAHITGAAHGAGGSIEVFMNDNPQKALAMGIRNGEMSENIPAGVTVFEDIALVSVHGVISKKVAGVETSSGMTDATRLEQAIRFVERDEQVLGVLFDIDSPGGSVTGTPEIAQMIKDLPKPTVAFCDSLMASAAYWLGCQCDAIYASKSASVGSIGVYMAWLDVSRAFEMQGIKTELIKVGKFKAVGVQGIALTDEQRELMEASTKQVFDWFRAAVLDGRGFVRDEAMEGQTFFAEDAMKENLIDAVGNLEDAVRELGDMIGA